MADEDTQVPLDWADVLDDEPLLLPTDRKDGSPSVRFAPEDNDEATVSPRRRWKRDCLSPQHKADLESGSSKPDASPTKKKPAGTERVPNSAKRLNVREDSRKANDIMDCFLARASTASSSTATKKKPAAASDTDVD